MTAASAAQRTLTGKPADVAPTLRDSLSALSLADLRLVVAPRWGVKTSTIDPAKVVETIACVMQETGAVANVLATTSADARTLLACLVARGGTVHQELAARAFRGAASDRLREAVNELYQAQLLLAPPSARSEPPRFVVPCELLPTLHRALALGESTAATLAPAGRSHAAQATDPFVALAQTLSRIAAMGGIRVTKGNAVHRVDVRKLTEWSAGRAIPDLDQEEAEMAEQRVAGVVDSAYALGLLRIRDDVFAPDPKTTEAFFALDRRRLLEILLGGRLVQDRYTGERHGLLALARALPDLDPGASYRVKDLWHFVLAHRVLEGHWPPALVALSRFLEVLENLSRLGLLAIEGEGGEALLSPTTDFQLLRSSPADATAPIGVRVLVVNADYEVVVLDPPRATRHLHVLIHACEPTRSGAPIFRITRESVERASKNGITAARIRQTLEEASGATLPQSVAYSVSSWSAPSASPQLTFEARFVLRGAGAAEVARARPDLFDTIGPDAAVARAGPVAAVAELVRRGLLPKGHRLTNYDTLAQALGTGDARPSKRELDTTSVPLGKLGLPATRTGQGEAPGEAVDYARLHRHIVDGLGPHRAPPPPPRFHPSRPAMPSFPASVDVRSIHNLARAISEGRPVHVTAKERFAYSGNAKIHRRGIPIEIRGATARAALVLAEGKRIHEIPLQDIREIRVA